jgi:NADPH-dependent ferric siderophore reductase
VPDQPETYAAEVRSAEPLGPNLVRLVLTGPDLDRYPALPVPDESVVVYLPGDGGEPAARNYTVRAFDPATGCMTIDFVRHEGGVAGQWAVEAVPGSRLRISRPRSWYRPPARARWQLLVADLTGLPALARIVEQRDPALDTRVVVEVVDERDLAALPALDGLAGLSAEVVVGSGNGHGPSALADRVEAITPAAGPGYLWFAGEAGQARRIRKHARGRWAWGPEQLDVIGYWRCEAERWNARYARVATELQAVYQDALAEGRSDREAAEVYDLALERVGL